jgi:hypothetical protein
VGTTDPLVLWQLDTPPYKSHLQITAARDHAGFRTALNVREFHWFPIDWMAKSGAVNEQTNHLRSFQLKIGTGRFDYALFRAAYRVAKFVGSPTHACAIF